MVNNYKFIIEEVEGVEGIAVNLWNTDLSLNIERINNLTFLEADLKISELVEKYKLDESTLIENIVYSHNVKKVRIKEKIRETVGEYIKLQF